MAELADAADSKSAGTWYLGGSTPPPGTINLLADLCLAASTLSSAVWTSPHCLQNVM
jgi:hypothetical protein